MVPKPSGWRPSLHGPVTQTPVPHWPTAPALRPPYMAVSLGVGENPNKRLRSFEEQLLALLSTRAPSSSTAAGRRRARQGGPRRATCGAEVNASKAPSQPSLKSSPGQPLRRLRLCRPARRRRRRCPISIFAGLAVPRMFERWRPVAANATVIRVDTPDPAGTLDRVRAALPLTI